jgi:hypothetical protein
MHLLLLLVKKKRRDFTYLWNTQPQLSLGWTLFFSFRNRKRGGDRYCQKDIFWCSQ